MISIRRLELFLSLLIICVWLPLAGAAGQKPLIGINVDVSGSTTGTARLALNSNYVDAVFDAGGLPVLLPPIESSEDVRRLVAMVDGIVLVGGRDISPARYGQDVHETTNLLHPRRENFDFMLIEEALRANKPILGVCLGMQQLNVATGGQMIQDIPSLTDSPINHKPGKGGQHMAHDVTIEEGTKVHALTGLTSLPVNSIHHQACVNPGRGVLVTARSADGIIEGIELEGRPFAIGIQWHPEYLTGTPEQLNIYKGLVEAARQAAAVE